MARSNVDDRPNKIAKGFTKDFERNKKRGRRPIMNPQHPDYNENLGRLILFGTLDKLAGFKFKIVKIKKPHPTDNGYTKEVYVLYKNRDKYK